MFAAKGLGVVGDVKDLRSLRDRPHVAIGIGDEGAPTHEHQYLRRFQPLAYLREVRL
jgi:hypothetical protein